MKSIGMSNPMMADIIQGVRFAKSQEVNHTPSDPVQTNE
jgi:hypothetical protein